jgi:hypothetical protein
MKDLILITAYCNTEQKKELLDRLLSFLNFYSSVFDIMVSSHTPLDIEIQNKCDYVIFDKENLLLYDDKIRPKLFFKTDTFTVNSNYISSFNTTYTVLKLESMGTSLANSLGYKKIHKIEYDTDISSIKELIDNSKLLNEFDTVCYTNDGIKTNFMSGSIWSSKILKLPDFYLKYQKNEVLEIIYQNGLSAEWLIKKYFTNNNCFYKNINDLTNQGIEIALSHKNFDIIRNNWVVPIFCEDQDKDLCLFSYNDKHEVLKISGIYDEFFEFELKPATWNLKKIGNLTSKNNLNIWINNQNTLNIDFGEIDIDNFKLYNNLSK